MEHEEAAAKSRGGACRSTRSGVPAALIGLILAVLGAGAAPAETAGCRPEGARGAATAESCVIAGTDYRLVRARASLLGTVGAAIDLLRDPASCAEWQAMCAEERFFADGAGHRSIRHRRSGEGFTRRVLVSRNSWWRLESGGALAAMVGDDRLGAEFEGTRILCLRERWTFTPLAGGRSQVTAAVVSDPQPPFGLTGVVTASTAETLLETLDNLAARVRSAPTRSGARLAALPTLSAPLPDVGASFASCQNARRR